MLIHIRNNTQSGLDLIRDIFHQLFNILHTDNITGIINANINGAALSIGKTAKPLQIFIPPGFFIFNDLTLCHKTISLHS